MTSRGIRGLTTERGRWFGSIGFAACGAVVVVVELIGGDPTGQVILATVVAFLVELGRGNSGAPYYWLAAIGGFAYLAAYAYGTRR
jgi:hypothetical protein